MAARIERIGLQWTRSAQGAAEGARWRVALGAEGSRVEQPAAAREGFVRASLDVEGSAGLGAGTLVWRTLAGAGTPGAGVPAQYLSIFGGPVSAPGYDFHSLAGRLGAAQHFEYRLRIPFISMNLGRFGRVPSSLVLAPYVHGVWLGSAGGSSEGFFPSVGIGMLSVFDLVRVDVARALRGGGWLFSLDVARDFWSVF